MKKFFVIWLMILLVIVPMNRITIEAYRENGTSITTQGAAYRWVFKLINGILYKRLYNDTTSSWVGEWIPA